MKKHILGFLALSLFSINAMASDGTSPLGLSIFAPVQLPPSNYTITGLRLDVLVGQHQSVYGLDLGGLGNMTSHSFAGIEVAGLFNWNEGEASIVGIQAAGVTNFTKGKLSVLGVQAAAIANSNQGESSVVGLQVALANLSPATKIYGFQVGAYNQAREVTGFQIGLINSTDNLHGLQIGLLNFNHHGMFSISPLLNFGF